MRCTCSLPTPFRRPVELTQVLPRLYTKAAGLSKIGACRAVILKPGVLQRGPGAGRVIATRSARPPPALAWRQP